MQPKIAIPDPHPSLPHTSEALAHGNDPTSLTDIDSPAATAAVKQTSGQRDRQRDFPILNT